MTYGMAVYEADGDLIWDTDGILARNVGGGQIAFGTSEYTTKSISVSGMLATDVVIVSVLNNDQAGWNVTVSAPTVSIQRNSARSGLPSTYLIQVFRRL
jgi:hypothetical protein